MAIRKLNHTAPSGQMSTGFPLKPFCKGCLPEKESNGVLLQSVHAFALTAVIALNPPLKFCWASWFIRLLFCLSLMHSYTEYYWLRFIEYSLWIDKNVVKLAVEHRVHDAYSVLRAVDSTGKFCKNNFPLCIVGFLCSCLATGTINCTKQITK